MKEIENDDLKRLLVEQNNRVDELNNQIQSYANKARSDDEDKQAWKQRCDMIDDERQKAHRELTEAKQNISILTQNMQDLQNQINMQNEMGNSFSSEIEQHLKTVEEYELRNNELQRALEDKSDKLNEVQAQQVSEREDLNRLREMNALLQVDLDNQYNQHSSYKMNSEKILEETNELKHQLQHAKQELEAEHAHARELELLVQKARHKEFEVQLDSNQWKEDLLQERDRANHSENQLKLQSRQNIEQAARLSELENELEHTKRLLTNERYERERLGQILKQSTQPLSTA